MMTIMVIIKNYNNDNDYSSNNCNDGNDKKQ